MPHKQLFFRAEAPGNDELWRRRVCRCRPGDARAKPKCVLIGKKWGRPPVCHDGVTNAKEAGRSK